MDINNPFETFQKSAFRLEALPQYLVKEEAKALAKFKKTGTVLAHVNNEWQDLTRKNIATGKTMKRLRLLSDRLTQYEEFETRSYPGLAVGEEIRATLRSRHRDDYKYDFWLFDETHIAKVHYEDDGTFVSFEIAEATEQELEDYRHWLWVFEQSEKLEDFIVRLQPPVTPKKLTREVLHGHKLEDDYRWLEDVTSKTTANWINKQNDYTQRQFDMNTNYDVWKSRLNAYARIESQSMPVRRGARHFYMQAYPDKDFKILYVKDSENGEPRVLLDLNIMEHDSSPSLDFWSPSPDGRLLAYGISFGGTEVTTLRVRDIDTGDDLAEEIDNAAKHGEMNWLDDGSGFYYVRGPQPGTVDEADLRMHDKAYLHYIGQPYKNDLLVFGEGRSKEDMLGLTRLHGAPYLAISVAKDWLKNDVYLLNIATQEVVSFIVGFDAKADVMPLEDKIIVQTNKNADNYKVLSVMYNSLESPMKSWKIIIPEQDEVLVDISISKSRIFAIHARDLSHEVSVYDHQGLFIKKLPSMGMALVHLQTRSSDDTVYINVQTMVDPGTHYKFNALKLNMQAVYKIATPHDPDDYEAHLEWTTAKDGTRLPLLIAYKKSTALDGKRPTILYGYGGFNNSEAPYYMGTDMAWIEAGGIYVDAVIRGGGEYGEAWHRAGILENKQTSFDDFIAHAEALVSKGYTDPDHIGIQGGSNGGLLVAVVAMQRPDLYKAVVSQVPLTDMVHFPHFLIASRWTSEYGDPQISEDFERIIQWSPYHNIGDDKSYPSFYITTAENDTRVHPMHALKMAARLQSTLNPPLVMLDVEKDAGHTSAKPKSKYIQDAARVMAFFGWQLGLSPRRY